MDLKQKTHSFGVGFVFTKNKNHHPLSKIADLDAQIAKIRPSAVSDPNS